ncbi:MAG: glycosyl transferase family 2 [Chitinophagaceae bacterium]
MKVIAVVVTYNRLSLLKECINALGTQTHSLDQILIVNNGSTDGTTEWLHQQNDLIAIQQPNLGGAWGFQVGIKEAYKLGADWIWLMDDDTIPYPNALEALVHAVYTIKEEDDEFGFFGSKAIWTDGSWHLMNKILEDTAFSGKRSVDYYKKKGITPSRFSTFVSMLLSKKAIKKVGLPIKEFFIWHDDIEYTHRITNSGMKGGLVEKSIVLHKTPTNYKNDIYNDSLNNLWKYRHGLRNQLYERRYEKGYGSYLRNVFKRMIVLPVKILKKRKSDRWAYIKMVWLSSWEALWFNPEKEYIGDHK